MWRGKFLKRSTQTEDGNKSKFFYYTDRKREVGRREIERVRTRGRGRRIEKGSERDSRVIEQVNEW